MTITVQPTQDGTIIITDHKTGVTASGANRIQAENNFAAAQARAQSGGK